MEPNESTHVYFGPYSTVCVFVCASGTQKHSRLSAGLHANSLHMYVCFYVSDQAWMDECT